MMKLYFTGDLEGLSEGICELCGDYHFRLSPDGLAVQVKQHSESALSVTLKNGKAEICYQQKHHFFRALGLLIEGLRQRRSSFEIHETPQFDTNGPMFDVSQGSAAPTVDAVRRILRQLAMMGMNIFMLYCEDSYEVASHPFFGYGRARYQKEELRELDRYAALFGIEMIPCIQTLAHLTDFLRWAPYRDVAEDDECLLVGEEKTYQLVEDLIREAVEPFSTRKIHIGMDEAWKLGRGKTLDRYGYTPPVKLMQQHLTRVLEIVDRLGLEPMMWSDMFFRATNDGKYYVENPLPQEVIDACPANLRMIYWDYYNHSEEIYEKMVLEHLRFAAKPIFAGGVWTWNGFGPHWETTFEMTHRALSMCKKHGIRDVFATIWGDRGTECLCTAAMLGISYFAESGYCEEVDFERFKRRFEFCCGVHYDDFYALEDLNRVPSCPEKLLYASNPAKWLLWQDALFGLFDKNIENLPLSEHYAALAERLKPACRRNGDYNRMFRMNRALSLALSEKALIGVRLKSAYDAGDRAALRALAEHDLPSVIQKIRQLRKIHFECWLALCKPQGWNIMDLRYGAILARLDTARTTLLLYLNGKLDRIEELEQTRLHFNGDTRPVPHCNEFAKIISASRIS